MANKRISKFEDVSIESTQIEKQRGKWNRISNNYVTNIKSATYAQREGAREKKREKEERNDE